MDESAYEALKRYVEFGDADLAHLRSVGEVLDPVLDPLVERFCARVETDAATAAILERSGKQLVSVRQTLRSWLTDVLTSAHDAAHLERTSRIIHTHVRVRLGPQYMIAAMNGVRAELIEAVLEFCPGRSKAVVRALNKALDLELAVMVDAYREAHATQVRHTERQRMQRRLEEVSHLANVGELAASLAHEIKNPLAGISGAIQVIRTALEPDDPRREIIAEILSQIDRLDRTVRDLLVYARPKPPARTEQNLGKVVQRTVKFLRQEPALAHLLIRFQGLDNAESVLIDEAQIEQVLSNLVLNAAHACREGGEVTIALSSIEDGARIEVIDTGRGMTRDSLERAFEPFFTTKARGTGLGLAICKRIVEAHQGEMTLESTEGQGTRVRVELPR
ncbi:MAG: hypothetical protein GY842_06765 [bacterium]|nr:hypothetical protein [bacterium]